MRRCAGEAEAKETPIGYVPTPQALDLDGLDLPSEAMRRLLEVSADDWVEELKGIGEFFTKFGDRLPQQMWDEYQAFGRRLGKRT
jgi:phosphoenolpyruvate carboxykinase (GTP)